MKCVLYYNKKVKGVNCRFYLTFDGLYAGSITDEVKIFDSYEEAKEFYSTQKCANRRHFISEINL